MSMAPFSAILSTQLELECKRLRNDLEQASEKIKSVAADAASLEKSRAREQQLAAEVSRLTRNNKVSCARYES